MTSKELADLSIGLFAKDPEESSRNLSLWLTIDELAIMKTIAGEKGISMEEILRIALAEYLDHKHA